MLGSIGFKAWRKIISLVLVFFLAAGPESGYAESAFLAALPEPGAMVDGSPIFIPVLVKGLVVHPDRPLDFDFLVDSGNDSPDLLELKVQSRRIAQYFLAAITVPEDQLWVNLSPYEKYRIVADELGQTVLGRDMLAQDYLLKQLTASIIYPERGLGKDFWARVYREAAEKLGTTDIPVDTFNKVWIVPAEATVFEKGHAVYVTSARLQVMLDSDYTARSAVQGQSAEAPEEELSKQVLREVVIPAIEKEVNEGKNFAVMRQIYYAAILAKWYRELIQNTLLADAYVGKNKVGGVESDEKGLKEAIYQRYIAAYKKGVFNYIREENRPSAVTGEPDEVVPRKYFSGGISDLAMSRLPLKRVRDVSAVNRTVGSAFLVAMAMTRASNKPAEVGGRAIVTPQEAVDYQAEVRSRFTALDHMAERQFSPPTSPALVAGIMNNNNNDVEGFANVILLKDNVPIQNVYQEVQGIVREIVGADVPVVEAGLDEIHVTVSRERRLGSGTSVPLTLDQLTEVVREDVRGVQSFDMEFVGPHLMPNGVVAMEFTTSAPEFLYLRRRAQERMDRTPPADLNGAYVPDIIHSTVAVIRDTKVPQATLKRLQERLNRYRSELKPIHMTVDRTAVIVSTAADRRFSEVREVPLGEGQPATEDSKDAAMKIDGTGQRVAPVERTAVAQNDLARKQQEDLRDKKKKKEEAPSVQPGMDTVEISQEARERLARDQALREQAKDAAMSEMISFMQGLDSVQVASSALAVNVSDTAGRGVARIPEVFTSVANWYQNLSTAEAVGVWTAAGMGVFIASQVYLYLSGELNYDPKVLLKNVFSYKHIKLNVLEKWGSIYGLARMLNSPDAEVRDKAKTALDRLSRARLVDRYEVGLIVLALTYKTDDNVWAEFDVTEPGSDAHTRYLRQLSRNLVEKRIADDKEAQYLIGLKILASRAADSRAWGAKLLLGLNADRMIDEDRLTTHLVAGAFFNADTRVQQGAQNILEARKRKGDLIAGVYIEAHAVLQKLLAAHSLQITPDKMWELIKEAVALEAGGRISDYFRYVPDTMGQEPIYIFEEVDEGYYDSMTGQPILSRRPVLAGYRDVNIPAHIEVVKKPGVADLAQKRFGGIDIKDIDVGRQPDGAKILFNEEAVRAVFQDGFNGLSPVIINITPVATPLTILGLTSPAAAAAPGASADPGILSRPKPELSGV